MRTPLHFYTAEELKFLENNCKGKSFHELTKLFNKYFYLSLSVDQIKSTMARYGFKNGRNTCFKPGHIPHNKGVKGLHYSRETEFKKGNRPVNYKPIGSERINVDGYIEIKIKDPNKWALKHRLIYEAAYGKIPKGHVVIFADTNRLNLSPSNLLLVTRKELVVMNKNKLIYSDKDLTKTGKLIASVKIGISDCQKRT
ncbi:MAG: HNH endonuclease [Spirochaetales bacterium]|nr:HNH endonuclease [Spirochaetales bacterium]